MGRTTLRPRRTRQRSHPIVHRAGSLSSHPSRNFSTALRMARVKCTNSDVLFGVESGSKGNGTITVLSTSAKLRRRATARAATARLGVLVTTQCVFLCYGDHRPNILSLRPTWPPVVLRPLTSRTPHATPTHHACNYCLGPMDPWAACAAGVFADTPYPYPDIMAQGRKLTEVVLPRRVGFRRFVRGGDANHTLRCHRQLARFLQETGGRAQ